MNNIKTLLNTDRYKRADPSVKSRSINERYEKAQEFGKYVGINTILVLRLFKLYGMGKVLNIRSWLADCPYDNKKGGKFALAIWKLKSDREKATPKPIDSGTIEPLFKKTGV